MWIWRENKDNPHYRRLILSVKHNPHPLWDRVLGLTVFAIILMGAFVLMSFAPEAMYYIFLLILFIFTMLSSAVAAWFVAQDCTSIAYELVRLTVLPSKKLATGYWHSFMKRLNWQMRWLPFTFVFFVVILNVYYAFFLHRNLPANPLDIERETAFSAMVVGWLVSLTIIWGYWIFPFLGVALGLSLKRPLVAAIVTLVVIPVLIGLWSVLASIFVFALPVLALAIIGFSVFKGILVFSIAMLAASLYLFLMLLIVGETAHGFAKENI